MTKLANESLPCLALPCLTEWFERFQRRLEVNFGVNFGYTPKLLAQRFYYNKTSFAELEEFGATVFRQYILERPDVDMESIIRRSFAYVLKRGGGELW